MLGEWLTSLATPFPRQARRLGYLHEQIAIRARERRLRGAWAGHLASARREMAAAAAGCPGRGLAVVVGAGVCLDVPIAELASAFARVVLVDVGFLDRTAHPRVERLAWDATGCLRSWHDRPEADEQDLLAAAAADPGWPEGLGDPDLIISANLIGQLAAIPAPWLARGRRRAEGFADRLGARLAQTHLAWLRRRPGQRLLVADLAEIAVAVDGAIADEQPLPAATLGLRAPDRTWMWDLAPIPEWDRDHHLRHRVGAWLDP